MNASLSHGVYDVVIVGGGIVGLAAGMELLERFPHLSLLLLEKEPALGAHQTSHNSGVIHSGIYYRPGSAKARTCVTGAKLMVEFCRAHGIRHELCGKLVVATEDSDVPALQSLYERGVANGVPGLSLVGPERLRELEPHARGVKALHVPGAGLVDYQVVAEKFAEIIAGRGGHIRTGARVVRFARREGFWHVETTIGELRSRALITCGGLHADRLAVMAGGPADVRIVPFRGEYYGVIPSRRFLVRSMIYPVPNPQLPFLGVHFTRSITGMVHAGPNAVLALRREGYRKTDVSLSEILSLMGFAGFWRMATKFWLTGLSEFYRSFSKTAFVQALQQLVPEIQSRDLAPAPSGVRAQAVDLRGWLLDDFDIIAINHALLIRNVPSPAATASISVGDVIAEMASQTFGFQGRRTSNKSA